MKKNELKSGMVVEDRNGSKRLVVGNHLIGNMGHGKLSYYDDELKRTMGNRLDIMNSLDIVKVYNYKSVDNFSELLRDDNLELIWERKEIELTNKEIEILKALTTLGFEFLARDEDNYLHAYNVKPYKVAQCCWDFNMSVRDKQYIRVHNDVFDFIKWEDEEPTNIDELLKEYNK